MPRRYLLSIDAGGIRGIIPAAALVKLEKTTGKLTREICSFLAGTETRFRIGSYNTLWEQYRVAVMK